jgi:hypothetical protein
MKNQNSLGDPIVAIIEDIDGQQNSSPLMVFSHRMTPYVLSNMFNGLVCIYTSYNNDDFTSVVNPSIQETVQPKSSSFPKGRMHHFAAQWESDMMIVR